MRRMLLVWFTSAISTSKKLESIFTSHFHCGKTNVPHGGFSAPHHVYNLVSFWKNHHTTEDVEMVL